MLSISISPIVNSYTEIEYRKILDSIIKYYNTLSKLGYISSKENKALLIYTFLLEYYQYFYSIMSNEDKQVMFAIFGCIDDKSCVFN